MTLTRLQAPSERIEDATRSVAPQKWRNVIGYQTHEAGTAKPRLKKKAAVRFERTETETLHSGVTRAIARRIIQADRDSEHFEFPTEGVLCELLGVSRPIVREALKVLADKGMVEIRPRSGMRSAPRQKWRLLDPDILAWRAEGSPDRDFLRDLFGVRLAIEPTAAGLAAARASDEDRSLISAALARRVAAKSREVHEIIDLDLQLHSAIVKASRNPLFVQLSAAIGEPFRRALACTMHLPVLRNLDLTAHRQVVKAIERHDPRAARAAADEIVGYAMLAVERAEFGTEAQKIGR
jgi:DNA-binding FadR family transcriptional regulator